MCCGGTDFGAAVASRHPIGLARADCARGVDTLQLDRTAQRVDNASEFDEEPVAGRFDNAAAMLDFGIDRFATQHHQRGVGALSSSPIGRE